MPEYKPNPLVCTGPSECMGAPLHACHSGLRDFPKLPLHSRGALCLVNLGFHFGRVSMSYVEVACLSTSLTPWFKQVPVCAVGLIRTHATPAPVISRSFGVSFRRPLGLVNLGFYFRRVGMREYKAPPFLCTGTLEDMGAHSQAYHSSALDLPELHVYSRVPLGLVNLGIHFERVGMR